MVFGLHCKNQTLVHREEKNTKNNSRHELQNWGVHLVYVFFKARAEGGGDGD